MGNSSGKWKKYPNIIEDVKEGDIIEFDRFLFSHFAVYIGKQNSSSHYVAHKVGDGLEAFSSSSPSSSEAWSKASKADRDRCTKLSKTRGVRIDLLEVVCDNQKCRKNNYIDEEFISRKSELPFSREEIVDRCMDKLSDCKYDWATDNCEHFATWCRTGISVSKQAFFVPSAVGNTTVQLIKLMNERKLYKENRQRINKSECEK